MPVSDRPPTPLPDHPPDDHDLATPEEVAAQKRRRRLMLWGSVAVTLLVFGGFVARPALRGIKAWQARRAAAAALQLLDQGKIEEAVVKVQDALTLRGSDPEVMRSAAVFLTRAGHGREALNFWKEIEKSRALTPDEQRDYATDLAQAGEPAEAARRLRFAWPEGTPGTPADWSLGLQIAARGRDAATAVKLARQLLDGKSQGVTERQRLEAALLLLGVNDPGSQAAGVAALHALADGGQSPESLDALLTLTRQAAGEISTRRGQQQDVPEASTAELAKLADRIEAHPRAQVTQRLLALQARVVAQPDQRPTLLQRAVDRYAHGTNDELAALGAWLYSQGEFARVLEVLPIARATASRALYLQYLDTLGSLGRWTDIRQAIEGQKFTLDPLIEEMYLARCAKQLHQPDSAETHWGAASRAAGTNPDKLLTLGRYAQGDGASATAETAFRTAIKVAPTNRQAAEALLGLLESQGRTRDLREAVRAMLALWPQDSAIRNDNAYLSALLGEDLETDRDTARELVRLEPQSLPHRVTLALVEMRLGHDLTALETLHAVNPASYAGQARFLAIYSAVLAKTGNEPEAAKAAAGLPRDRLLPEEKQLIRETKS